MAATKDTPLGFTLVFEEGEDGYYVGYCEEIPGVVSQGKTIPELEANLSEALFAALESLARRYRHPHRPKPSGRLVATTKVGLKPIPA